MPITTLPTITIIDDLHPEDNAMLQALQSRSPASVEERLQKVREAGSGQFMDKFYVGYGHRSIGDCGVTTIFIEGVTMLVAKAIQDWPLYSGQEASTRYMDFSTAEFFDPTHGGDGKAIQERWREFYLRAQEPVRKHLREKYPRNEGEDEKAYARAIKARSFDILRAFLPAGATTNLSWTTNLRQAQDHLDWLTFHPDDEVSALADNMLTALSQRYKHSFDMRPRAEIDAYRDRVMEGYYFLLPDFWERYKASPSIEVDAGRQLESALTQAEVLSMLLNRPKGAEVPWFLANLGQLWSTFPLDFGSYRDLQRHRNGIIRMPLLTTKLGFHPWYLEELPNALRAEARELLGEQEHAIESLSSLRPIAKQNLIAMGYQVPCHVTQSLPGFIYRLELRSGKTVHPTLRQVIHEEIRQFRRLSPTFAQIPLHVDMDLDSWTVRRGTQTIEER